MKLMVLAAALSLPLAIVGQSVNSGIFQVLGSFDASSGTWSKPMVAVTSDPSGACSNPASMVINVSTGSQKGDISACINGAWTLTNGLTNAASSSSQFAPSYSGGGVTFGSCSAGSPCYLAPNNQLDTYISTPTVTPGTGTAADTLFIYGVPGSNTIQVGKASTNSYGCSGCQVNSGISAPPSNSYAIYKCTVTGGQIVSGGCTPLSTPYSNTSFEDGLGTMPLIDTATGALQINNNRNPRFVTSGNDTITNLDCGGMVIYKETSTMNVALPQAGIGNPVTFASGCDIWLVNIGTGSVQVTPNSSSPINGSTAMQKLAAGSASAPTGMYLVSNGSAFDGIVIGSGSGVGSGGPVSISGTNPQVQISNPTTTGYLSYQLNGDTQRYQLGLGNSGAGGLLATNLYFYDSTNGAPRMVMNNSSDVLWNGTTTSPSSIDSEVTAASPGAEWLGNGTTKNVLLQLQNTNASWTGNANIEFKTSVGNSYLGVGGPSSPTAPNALYVTLPTSGLLFEAPFSTGIFEIQHGLSVGVNGITFNATPTFDLSKGDPTITLTGNVTSSTITNLVKGARVAFQVCQDSTGSRTFVWPSNVRGAMTIGATAGKCNVQMFESFDGASLVALGPGVTNQ